MLFIIRSKSAEDLLSMSQIEYDQLDSLSQSPRSNQLCLCDQNTVSCSYKYNGCKTKDRGKEYLCGLHTSSRRRRDIRRVASFINNEEFNGLSVSLTSKHLILVEFFRLRKYQYLTFENTLAVHFFDLFAAC